MAAYNKITFVDMTTPGTGTPYIAANENHTQTQYDCAQTEYQNGNWGAPPSVPTANLTGRITLAMMKDAIAGYVLKGQGIGSDPIYALLLAADIPSLDAAKITTGIFGVAQGGLGLGAFAQGGIPYSSGADTFSRLAPAGANLVLRSTGPNALQFAALDPADLPNHSAALLTSGSIPESRLPAPGAATKGGVALPSPLDASVYYDGSGNFSTPPGSGGGGDVSSIDVVSVDNQLVRENGTSGKSHQKSLGTMDDSGTINLPAGQQYNVNGAQHQHAAADVASGRILLARMTDGTVAQYLRAAGAGLDPAYATPQFSEMASGQITLAQTARGTSGQFLKGQGASDPIFAALTAADWTGRITALQLLDGASAQFLAGNGLGSSPGYRAIALADLPTITPAYGGTGQTTVPTKGDIPIGGSSILNLLGVGSNGQVLTANPGAAYGVDWETPASAMGGMVEADYIIYVSGGAYYALNGATGAVNYSGAYFHTVVNQAINALTNGGTVFIKSGAYSQTAEIVIKSHITIRCDRNVYITLAAGSNCHMISTPGTWTYVPGTPGDGNDAVANYATDFHIFGGTWDGNYLNQTRTSLGTTACRVFYFVGSQDFSVENLNMVNAMSECIGGIKCLRMTFRNCHLWNGWYHGMLLYGCSNIKLIENHITDMGTMSFAGPGADATYANGSPNLTSAGANFSYVPVGGMVTVNLNNGSYDATYADGSPNLVTTNNAFTNVAVGMTIVVNGIAQKVATKSDNNNLIMTVPYSGAYTGAFTYAWVKQVITHTSNSQMVMDSNYTGAYTGTFTYTCGGGGVYAYCEDDSHVQVINNNLYAQNIIERVTRSGLSISIRGTAPYLDIGRFAQMQNNILVDCGLDGTHPGINMGWSGAVVRTAQNCCVSNNVVYETVGGQTGGGILIQGNNIAINGNSVYNVYDAHLNIRGNFNTIVGNTLDTQACSSYAGIQLWDASYCTVSANTISGFNNRGIYLTESIANSNNNIITGNILVAPAGANRFIQIDANCNNNMVHGNNCSGGTATTSNAGTGSVIRDNVGIADN